MRRTVECRWSRRLIQLRRSLARDQHRHKSEQQHRRPDGERRDAARSEDRQNGRPDAEAAGDAGAVERDVAAAIGVVRQLVDPELRRDEQSVQSDAECKAQRKPRPETLRLEQREQGRRREYERSGHERRCAESPHQARHLRRHEERGEAGCRQIESVDRSGESAALQDQREQRQGQAHADRKRAARRQDRDQACPPLCSRHQMWIRPALPREKR